MKELTNFELVHINGGEEISTARKAGRLFGDFLGYCAAVVVYVSDMAYDAVKTLADLK